MSHIPYLKTENNRTTLYVDGEPFQIRGGELHNSSGSSLAYMEEHVWPGLRRLGGNCYLTPVYWECLEPEPGKFDFTLVDGTIQQARREGVRLVFLWFGLWKNGSSSYAPAWIKQDPECFYMVGDNGRKVESVSPFCEKAVKADKNAFEHLMRHLKEIDEDCTVIMIQVENEVGIWGSIRDRCEVAESLYQAAVPADVAEKLGASGTWEEAFGLKAPEYFMIWGLGSAVGEIAQAGKDIYPLPMFMNCVPNGMGISQLAGSYPSGGPVAQAVKIWRKFAPAIDLYGPDIYVPFYKMLTDGFAAVNAVVVPETGQGKDCISKALFTFGAYNTICFSPFGIDGMMQDLSENDLLAQMNMDRMPPKGMLDPGEQLASAYKLLAILEKEIVKAQEEHRIWAFLEQGMGDEFLLDQYRIMVTYQGNTYSSGMPPMMPRENQRREDAPIGGGFILQTGEDEFLICGVSANITFLPKYGKTEELFILNKEEYLLGENELIKGRILNGDERNFLAFGSGLGIQKLKFYRKK